MPTTMIGPVEEERYKTGESKSMYDYKNLVVKCPKCGADIHTGKLINKKTREEMYPEPYFCSCGWTPIRKNRDKEEIIIEEVE